VTVKIGKLANKAIVIKMFVKLQILLLLVCKESLCDREKLTSFLYSVHSNYVKSLGLIRAIITKFKFTG
jgi:hypothetical protein